ncbi:hypothetical protein ABIB25_004299 [Nakamurella sp. UYEF19]|uniref:hypothetical protein n=1 Tax=Nakamurella sp. UYEF19 TaxID=1756392 RepID=UPI00339910BF
MTAYAFDTTFHVDCAAPRPVGEIALEAADLGVAGTGYGRCLERACGLLLARGWDTGELYWAQLFDLPSGPEKSSLMQVRDALGFPTDPDAYLMCTPLGARISFPEYA